jgi:hypothetical protein
MQAISNLKISVQKDEDEQKLKEQKNSLFEKALNLEKEKKREEEELARVAKM